jgi:hypothetical protein
MFVPLKGYKIIQINFFFVLIFFFFQKREIKRRLASAKHNQIKSIIKQIISNKGGILTLFSFLNYLIILCFVFGTELLLGDGWWDSQFVLSIVTHLVRRLGDQSLHSPLNFSIYTRTSMTPSIF